MFFLVNTRIPLGNTRAYNTLRNPASLTGEHLWRKDRMQKEKKTKAFVDVMETIDRFLPSNVWWGFLFIGWDGRWACIFLYIYWWRMVLPEISCPSQDCRRLVQLFPGRGSGSLTRPEKRRRIYRLRHWAQQCQALWSPKEPCQHAYRVNRLLTNFIYIYILGIMRKLCLCGGANINILGSRSKYIFRCKQGKPFFFFSSLEEK